MSRPPRQIHFVVNVWFAMKCGSAAGLRSIVSLHRDLHGKPGLLMIARSAMSHLGKLI